MRSSCRALRSARLGEAPALRCCKSMHISLLSSCRQSQRRYLWGPLLRGVHDTFMSAVEIGGWVTGKQAMLPCRSIRSNDENSNSYDFRQRRHFQLSTLNNAWKVAPPENPTADLDTDKSLPEQLRSVFRLLTNPVVVCTATHNGTPRAMTMSSFTSLTLSPAPLVSFNIATPSRTLEAIASSGTFNIHILAGDEAGAAIADHFTRGNVDGIFNTMEDATCTQETSEDAPLLQGKGVMRVLRCKLVEDGAGSGLVCVRDHVIVVGEVTHSIPGNEGKHFALAYADRKYRLVGGVIENQ